AVDHQAIVFGQLDIVAMAPDVRKALEVCGMVFGAVGVVPESYGHRGKWRRADKLAADARPRRDRLAVVVEDVDRESEAAALQLSPPHGQRRIAEREAGNDVSASRDRRQAQVVLDALIDVVEAVRRERTAGGEHRPQMPELEI